jgi:hypothetical protein
LDYLKEQLLVVYEAAWFAFRHHYEDLAEYLDLSDEVLKPIMQKLDQQLNENEVKV